MSCSRFFSRSVKYLTTPFGLVHTAAYAIYMAEDTNATQLDESDDKEALYRFMILLGSGVLGAALGYLRHKGMEYCAERRAANDSVAEPTRCRTGVKNAIVNFHVGFALSAGSLAFAYPVLSFTDFRGHREIEPLSAVSTVGTIVGLVYAIQQACKKTAVEENTVQRERALTV